MTSMPRSTTTLGSTTPSSTIQGSTTLGPATCLGLTLALAATARAGDAPATGATTVKLEPIAWEADEVVLPAPRHRDVAGGFPIRHGTADRFQAAIEGDVLRVDLDGDGTLDARIEGDAATVTLTGTSPEGRALRYTANLARFEGGPWKFTCGSAMSGEIAGVRVAIVDQNLNGSFDDVGEDAIVVGRDGAASFLSEVVSIGGALQTIRVARDGASLEATPYTGPKGTLDLVSGFDSKAKLRAAVVRSEDGRLSFNLSKAKGGLAIPAGRYVLVSGQIVLGSNSAEIHTGRARPIEVAPDGTSRLAWGGPVQGEFSFQRDGAEVQFTPWDIWYYGRAGEEYSKFLPLGTSPVFAIADAATGKSLVDVQFPGNC